LKYSRLMILVNAILILAYGVFNWDIWQTVYEIIINVGYVEYAYSKFFWSPFLIHIDYGIETWITFPNLSIIMLLLVASANLIVIWKMEKTKIQG